MDKISLITGVSRDMELGYETAKQLADLGYKVIITAHGFAKIEQLAKKINVMSMQLDITNEQNVNQLAGDIEKRFGKLDVLVNSEGAYFDQGGDPLSIYS